jgi:uncharacterized protein YndB with AHSA1/START domain
LHIGFDRYAPETVAHLSPNSVTPNSSGPAIRLGEKILIISIELDMRYRLFVDSKEPAVSELDMILRILVFVVIAVIAILFYAASKPSVLVVQRTTTIDAPPEKVFAIVDDFRNWPKWNPQDRDDPALSRTYRGANSGTGAISDWNGKGESGKGTMTITESVPYSKISVGADWSRPFQTHNVNEFDLAPAAAGTRVTWTLRATNLFIMKVMGVFTNMDKNIGGHLESGLTNLKAATESGK